MSGRTVFTLRPRCGSTLPGLMSTLASVENGSDSESLIGAGSAAGAFDLGAATTAGGAGGATDRAARTLYGAARSTSCRVGPNDFAGSGCGATIACVTCGVAGAGAAAP